MIRTKAFHLFLFIIVTVLAVTSVGSLPVKADFVQNNLIDDGVFNDTNTMSAAQIQTFLNAFPNSCLANYQAPYPTDYFNYGANVSAATVIRRAADLWGINPRVILTTLEKEESLVSGNVGCAAWQYNSAMGMGCPDSGACPAPEYAGFSQQVTKGAWQLEFSEQRAYGNLAWDGDGSVQYYGFMTAGTRARVQGGSSVYYDGTAVIDGTTVTMTNGATAALYTYTPHFHGNQNFVSIFESWFGSTKNSSLNFSVIQGPNSPALYLETSAGKYYLPSGAIMQQWGLDKLPVMQVSQYLIDSLNTGPWVSNLLKDDWNNYFVVENGTLHYVRDPSYLALWNLLPSNAVQSLGITHALTSGSWLGRFIQDVSLPSGQMWLMDKGQKHAVSTNMLYEWRYTPDQLTTVSATFLSSITTNATAVTAFASDGSNDYLIDSGRKLSFSNSNVENAYYGAQTAVVYDPTTLSYLPVEAANQFIIDATTGQWFMLEADKKHYVPNAGLAQLWGKSSSTGLTSLSDLFVVGMTDGGNLSYVVQTSSPTTYWLVDGTKHHINDTSMLNAWLPVGQTPPTYSLQSLNLLTLGADASATINATGSPYSYLMDAGVKHYLMSPAARSGWGTTVMNTTSTLVNMIPEGSFLNYIAKNADGNAYLLMNTSSYLIDPSYYADWGVTSGTITLANSTISRYTSSGITLRAYISIGGSSFAMLNGYKIPISTNADAYQPATLGQSTLPTDYFPTTTEATYLAKSTNTSDSSVYLISGGKKYLFSGFATYVSYGYLSRGVAITTLTPEALALIPNGSGAPGLFIRTASSYGVKFINFGTSLGFPDGDTLSNLIGSTPILIVSDSIYNSFPLVGSVSRILKDDAGKIYLVENGTKRWITNSNAYDPYRHYPVTYLYGTTMSLIPDGPAIN